MAKSETCFRKTLPIHGEKITGKTNGNTSDNPSSSLNKQKIN